VLVNNAGIFAIEDIESTSLALWERVFAVNQTGVFLGIKHAAPALRASGGGSIVNVSSIGGLVGFGPAAAYQASKGAVRLLSKNAAIRYASERIRVNSLHPGVIRTQMADDIDDAVIAGFDAQTPMGLGEPLDIAYAALFLASDESKYMTGSELVVDGGYSAR
jgi:NAD(P)-dependent dehydrogenase (short-subunit alcohol dehydrogenase family)